MLEDLTTTIRKCWSSETAQGTFDPDLPETGQCAVSALVVQYYCGGILLRCPVEGGGSHYWNSFGGRSKCDMTVAQFTHPDRQPLWEDTVERDREYVLSFPETAKRYKILRDRVEALIGKP